MRFFPRVSPTTFFVTQKCQAEGTLTGSSINVNREFQIKPRNITVRNYNLSVDINVDSTIFTDGGIRADYDSQRTVQQAMIQMKFPQISQGRERRDAKQENCRLYNFIKSEACYGSKHLSVLIMWGCLHISIKNQINGNLDLPLTLAYLLIQSYEIHSSVKYFERMIMVYNK